MRCARASRSRSTRCRRAPRVGTSSMRRQCQLLARRPDLKIEMLRGNVPTRVAASLDVGRVRRDRARRRRACNGSGSAIGSRSCCRSRSASRRSRRACSRSRRATATRSPRSSRCDAIHDAHVAAAVTAERAFLATHGRQLPARRSPRTRSIAKTAACGSSGWCGLPDGTRILHAELGGARDQAQLMGNQARRGPHRAGRRRDPRGDAVGDQEHRAVLAVVPGLDVASFAGTNLHDRGLLHCAFPRWGSMSRHEDLERRARPSRTAASLDVLAAQRHPSADERLYPTRSPARAIGRVADSRIVDRSGRREPTRHSLELGASASTVWTTTTRSTRCSSCLPGCRRVRFSRRAAARSAAARSTARAATIVSRTARPAPRVLRARQLGMCASLAGSRPARSVFSSGSVARS